MKLLEEGAATLGIQLDNAQIDQFLRYYLELVDWNSWVNLTRVTGREEVQVRHFLDSLAVSAVLSPGLLGSGERVLDLGSGAGLPGVPLKIAFPGLRMTLMDATAKKTAFLAHVTQQLGLRDIQICTGRAEELAHNPGLRESFGVVVSRAVAKLPVLAELALAFCRVEGTVVAQKGASVYDEVRQAQRAIEAMGGLLREVREVAVEGSGKAGALVVLEKRCPTPARYPRRPGIPSKRPL